ncbi:MAG TPA: TIGR01777 family oxidoreductase [Thermoanaerobaculia bacterium]|nr:TIGR01777 family oxidoreductase [Thermoanaerobaculia bacterium]
MKIVIPGGSGHLGSILARALHGEHDVVVLTRGDPIRPWRTVKWDGVTPGNWIDEIDGADVVINLAGRSVNCRYNAANRAEIMRSRVDSTRAAGHAIASVARPPHLWLQAATATIYAHRYDAANDEEHGIAGWAAEDAPDSWRFSIDVARAWEAAVDEIRTPRTRRVKMRTAMVMSPERRGAFDLLLRLARAGLGGRAGDGRQFVSWIHHEDFVRAIRFLINKPFIDGVINLAAPNPLPNAGFMRAIRDGLGIRTGLPATKGMLEIGSFLMRTESELILKSRRVTPARLLRYGFAFQYPEWPDAAGALCDEWRALRGRPVSRIAAMW